VQAAITGMKAELFLLFNPEQCAKRHITTGRGEEARHGLCPLDAGEII
jgi:hypothetical protein